MSNNEIKNPWLGLKSYPEGRKIYGRDVEIEELSQKILYNTQTVIYGKSGIGKSSILKAGVFPMLRKHGYFPVYVRFVHDEDQESYTAQIIAAVRNALKKLRVEDLEAPEESMLKIVEGFVEEVVPHYDENAPEGLWEFFHRHRFYYRLYPEAESEQVIPVLIFDQFEEIFTLQKNQDKVSDFFVELASLINNICPKHLLYSTVEVEDIPHDTASSGSLIKKGLVKTAQKRLDYIDETNLRFVLSLREDYLSHLERNITHIPALKNNRYCLLPLSEDKAVDIIMKPVPGLVDQDVAKAIICKVTGAEPTDFEIDDNPELEVDSAILSLYLSELYKKKSSDVCCITSDIVEKLGSDIISDFYQETMGHVSADSVHFLEKRLVTKEQRRDSIYVDQAIRHGVTRKEIDYLVDQRLLHEYTWREGRRIEFAHDVLCPIVHSRLVKRTQEAERLRREEQLLQAQREKKRLRYTLFGTLLSIVLCAFIIYDGFFDVKEARYASIIKVNSWMKGFDKMSAEKASYLPYHYVFYKKGRFSKYPYAVEARDGYGKLTSDHNMSTYLVNHADLSDESADADIMEKLGTVVRWELLQDNTGEFCIQEKAFDKDDNVIYCYNNTRTDDPHKFVSTYVDELGFPIMMRDSCYIYLRTTLSEDGYEILQEFYDNKGFPVKNKDGAFKTLRSYFENGLQKREASLFIDGSMMVDRWGNCGWEKIKMTDDKKRELISVSFDDNYYPCRISDNVMLHRYEYDQYGRMVSDTYWRVEDTTDTVDDLAFYLEIGLVDLIPDVNENGIHGYVVEYNEHGQSTYYCTIDKDGNPCKASDNSFVEIIRDYDENGNMILEEAVDENDLKYFVYQAEYDDDEVIRELKYNITEEADTLVDYSFEWNAQRCCFEEKDYYHYGDWYRYKEYDTERRCILSALYTIEENLPDADSDGLHKTEFEYNHKGEGVFEVVERYYDVEDVPCGWRGAGSYHKEIMVVDSAAHTKEIIRLTSPMIINLGYDDSGEMEEILYQGFINHYDGKDFHIKIAESSIDQYGRKVRTYENGAYYYKQYNITSICPSRESSYIGYYAINEFGELSLTRDDGELYAAKINGVKYDENGVLMDSDENEYPLVASIEASEDLGFRLGDILVQQDDYTMWEYSDGDLLYGLDLTPDYNVPHVFKVLRFNEDTSQYDVVEIRTEAGDERVMSIEYMRHYMTYREKERIKDILRDNIYPHMFKLVPDEDGCLYQLGLSSEAYVLRINDWDMTQHFKGEVDSLRSVIRSEAGKVKRLTLYNGESGVMHFEVEGDTLGVHIDSYSLTPAYYDQILKIYNESEK